MRGEQGTGRHLAVPKTASCAREEEGADQHARQRPALLSGRYFLLRAG